MQGGGGTIILSDSRGGVLSRHKPNPPATPNSTMAIIASKNSMTPKCTKTPKVMTVNMIFNKIFILSPSLVTTSHPMDTGRVRDMSSVGNNPIQSGDCPYRLYNCNTLRQRTVLTTVLLL